MEQGLSNDLPGSQKSNYLAWLGESIAQDLEQTNRAIASIGDIDLVIVDHYALDSTFESGLNAKKVMVIDDLMNRKHMCDILLDQNITADEKTYHDLVDDFKPKTIFLLGPGFALLREEFRLIRQLVSSHVADREIKKIFIMLQLKIFFEYFLIYLFLTLNY